MMAVLIIFYVWNGEAYDFSSPLKFWCQVICHSLKLMAPIKVQSQGYTQIHKWVCRLDELSAECIWSMLVCALGCSILARMVVPPPTYLYPSQQGFHVQVK